MTALAYTDDALGAVDPSGDGGRTLLDTLAVLKRRGKLLLGVMGVLWLIVAIVAMALPPVYKSTATILIQEQEIPQELVRSTVTSFADERIQVISQQIMTRAVLLDLVNRYKLYPAVRDRETSEELLDRMRRDIKLSPISADVTDRRTGTQTKATIAFALAYQSESASDAQKIANELTTLFLNENVKNRQQKAAETSTFLQEELGRLNTHISEVEKQLAAFKEKNQGKLPELTVVNLQTRERVESDLLRTERDVQSLQERKILLQGQLAQVKPAAPLTATTAGAPVLDPEDKLRSLQAQLASATGIYSEDHPDVKAMRREIASLEAETGSDGLGQDRRREQVDVLRARLEELRRRYSEDYPDVQATRRALASAERAASAAYERPARKPDNPFYVSTQTQIESTDAEIAAVRKLQAELRGKLNDVEERLAQTPVVEREYLELTRDQESSRMRFRELREKQMQAEIAEQLERDRKAERFTLIDPAIYPEKPFSPNRIAILAIGFVVALLGGIAVAGLREATDQGVHRVKDILQATRAPVLAVIPLVVSAATLRRRIVQRRRIVVGSLLLLLVAVAWLHFFVMPIEVAWYALLRRLGV